MKKAYMKPKAVMVEYSYDDNVVASSTRCTISVWRYGDATNGFNCSAVRLTDPPPEGLYALRSVHPCDQYVIEGIPYAD